MSVSHATDAAVLPDHIAALRDRLHARSRAIGAAEASGDPPRRAAILIPLIGGDGDLQTVVFERTLQVADHKGEICFPGGSIEQGDIDPVGAALREAEEELGIRASDVVVLGLLDDVRTMGSNFVITPVVGYMSTVPEIIADEREVARVVVIRLDARFKSSRFKEMVVIRGAAREVDAYPIEGGRIWGATLRALDLLLDAMKG
jgi:8-oxo-dGTP pyrophosphatase MutT (NUDIX family)